MAKIFEFLVHRSVNILIDEQHGFRPGHSTTTCNITLTDYVMDVFSKLFQIYVVYTDFTKAFDRLKFRL